MSRRVLIVEDEAMVALDLAQELSLAGFEIVGPAASVTKALALVRSVGCDVAVLDVNLGDETSVPIAQELLARGTAFIVVSGYSRERHWEGFGNAQVFNKPVRPGILVAALEQCVAAAKKS